MDLQQRAFDFTRAEQLGLLREARIGPRAASDGANVSEATQKAVLRVIDDHGRGAEAWLGFETIATEAGCSVRTAKRAVQVLEAASLICVETRRSRIGVVCNHYRLVWSELALLRQDTRQLTATPPERSAVVTERSAVVTERSAVVTERSAVVTIPECRGDTQTDHEAQLKRTEPPPQSPSRRFAAGDRSAAGGGGWCELVQEWRSRIGQIAQIAAEAQATGARCEWFASELRRAWDLATHPANSQAITKPAGAVVYRLRTGTWPVEGLVDPADAAAAADALARQASERRAISEAEARRQAESIEQALQAAVRALRRRGANEEQIAEQLVRRFPREVVAAAGWLSGGSAEVAAGQNVSREKEPST